MHRPQHRPQAQPAELKTYTSVQHQPRGTVRGRQRSARERVTEYLTYYAGRARSLQAFRFGVSFSRARTHGRAGAPGRRTRDTARGDGPIDGRAYTVASGSSSAPPTSPLAPTHARDSRMIRARGAAHCHRVSRRQTPAPPIMSGAPATPQPASGTRKRVTGSGDPQFSSTSSYNEVVVHSPESGARR